MLARLHTARVRAMRGDSAETLVDRIYEAAVVPELWPNVIEAMGGRAEAALGSLVLWKEGVSRWIGTPAADKLIADYVAFGQPDLNTRVIRESHLGHVGFYTDYDVFAPEQIAHEPFYRDFLYPRGYGWFLGTAFASPTGEILYFSLERNFARGPFEQKIIDEFNHLRPHLGRAALMASRLDLRNAQAMVQALQTVGLPAAVLRQGGRLYALNPLFERLVPDVVRDRRERMALVNSGADALLARAVIEIDHAGKSPSVQSIPVAATEAHVAMIVHLLPVRGVARDVFAQSQALVVITPVDRRAVPTAEVLQGLFDLTPAEARVARMIAEGQTLEAFAERFKLSHETVRNQLKAVMGKTGVHRQAELAALLAGTALRGES